MQGLIEKLKEDKQEKPKKEAHRIVEEVIGEQDDEIRRANLGVIGLCLMDLCLKRDSNWRTILDLALSETRFESVDKC